MSPPTMWTRRSVGLWVRIGLLCCTYVLVARLGLLFAIAPSGVSPVWPLAGLIFVVLLRGGSELWPGVLIGDFLTALSLGFSPLVAGGVAIATTVEVVLALIVLRPLVGPTLELDSLREVLTFVWMTIAVSVPVGATIATLVFLFSGLTPWTEVWIVWRSWWIGDVMGILVAGPALLALNTLRYQHPSWPRIVEGCVLFGLLIVTTYHVMSIQLNYAYLLFVFIIWAALSYGPRGTAGVTALISVITVSSTVLGEGPFVLRTIGDGLFFLQLFLAVLTMTGLILSALVAEYWRREQHTRLAADIGSALLSPLRQEQLAQAIAERLTETFADACLIDMLGRDGKVRRVARATTHPAHLPLYADLFPERGAYLLSPPEVYTRMLQARRAVLVEAPDANLSQLVITPVEHQQTRKLPRLCAIIIAPIIAAERNFGAMLLINASPARVYRPDDVELINTLVNRLAYTLLASQLDADLGKAQKLEAIGRLAGEIAHDFNNLLTVIKGSADLVLEDVDPLDSQRQNLKAISLAADQAKTLALQLRLVGKQAPMHVQEVDFNELVARMILLLRMVLGSTILLKYEPGEMPLAVRLDPAHLERVLVNLATNARDAMPEGGTLTLHTGTATIALPHLNPPDLRPGHYAFVSVSDTGSGIPPELHDRIFEPFFTTKGIEQGRGLGLATSYSLVKQTGGTITVASELDCGTTFTVYVPLQK